MCSVPRYPKAGAPSPGSGRSDGEFIGALFGDSGDEGRRGPDVSVIGVDSSDDNCDAPLSLAAAPSQTYDYSMDMDDGLDMDDNLNDEPSFALEVCFFNNN